MRKLIWQDRGCVPCAYFPKGVYQKIGSYDSLFPNWYQEDQMKVQINQFFFSISNTCMLASGLGLRNNSLVQKIGCVSPVSLHWVLSVVKISDRFTNYLLYLQLFLIYIWLCNVTNYIPVYLTVNSVVHRMFQYIFSTMNLPIPTNARNGARLPLVHKKCNRNW